MPELFQMQTKEGYVEMIQNYRELLWEIKENLKQSGKITKSRGFPLDNLTLPCLPRSPSRLGLHYLYSRLTLIPAPEKGRMCRNTCLFSTGIILSCSFRETTDPGEGEFTFRKEISVCRVSSLYQ